MVYNSTMALIEPHQQTPAPFKRKGRLPIREGYRKINTTMTLFPTAIDALYQWAEEASRVKGRNVSVSQVIGEIIDEEILRRKRQEEAARTKP